MSLKNHSLMTQPTPAEQETIVTDWWYYSERVGVSTVLGFFSLICIFGNALVVLAVASKSYLHYPTSYLIVSMALADLIVGLVVMPISICIYALNERWPLGLTLCDIWHSLDILASTASIWNLCIISLDRYLAVRDPINYRDTATPRRITLMILCVWGAACLLSFPAIAWWRFASSSKIYADPTVCQFTDDVSYVVFSSVVSFYLPLCVTCFAYYRVFLKANLQERSLRLGRKKIKNNNTRRNNNKERRKSTQDDYMRMHRGGGGGNSFSRSGAARGSTTIGGEAGGPRGSTSSLRSVMTSIAGPATEKEQQHEINSLKPSVVSNFNQTAPKAAQIIIVTSSSGLETAIDNPLPPSQSPPSPPSSSPPSPPPSQSPPSPPPSKSPPSPPSSSPPSPPPSQSPPSPPQSSSISSKITTINAHQLITNNNNNNRKQSSFSTISIKKMSKSSIVHSRQQQCRPQTPQIRVSSSCGETVRICDDPENPEETLLDGCDITAMDMGCKSTAVVVVEEGQDEIGGGPPASELLLGRSVSRMSNRSDDCCSMNDENSHLLDDALKKADQKDGLIEDEGDEDVYQQRERVKTLVLRSSAASARLKAAGELTGSTLIGLSESYNNKQHQQQQQRLGTIPKSPSGVTLLALPPSSSSGAGGVQPQQKSSSIRRKFNRTQLFVKLIKEKRAAKTLGLVVGCFILCWLPFFTVNILLVLCPTYLPNPRLTYMIVTWLGYCNSSLNPIIYSTMSREFKRAFREIIFGKKANPAYTARKGLALAIEGSLSVMFLQYAPPLKSANTGAVNSANSAVSAGAANPAPGGRHNQQRRSAIALYGN